MKIIGPFKQIITLDKLSNKGPISDEDLQIIENGGVAIAQGVIQSVQPMKELFKKYPTYSVEEVDQTCVLLPGFVDCHTHTCFAGSRANDFASRNAGNTYLEIAQSGGGIWSTVLKTRQASEDQLVALTVERVNHFLNQGITTIEIKSGYGLNMESELKMLRAIHRVSQSTKSTVVSTCLAAHIKPNDFEGHAHDYLTHLIHDLLPQLIKQKWSKRVDIFIEKTAFNAKESREFLSQVKKLGFDITVHADQFTPMGSRVAVEVGAVSADHLEASTVEEINLLANSDIISVVLPGASMGLGEPFAPARKLLDAGASVAIASDYNPGSAPMGQLLLQASVLASYQKLTTAEVLAGLCFRAAKALHLKNIGKISPTFEADLQAYPCDDYREILYHQGSMKPIQVWKGGVKIL